MKKPNKTESLIFVLLCIFYSKGNFLDFYLSNNLPRFRSRFLSFFHFCLFPSFFHSFIRSFIHSMFLSTSQLHKGKCINETLHRLELEDSNLILFMLFRYAFAACIVSYWYIGHWYICTLGACSAIHTRETTFYSFLFVFLHTLSLLETCLL